jgi:glycine hydroxymethyltransferase
MLSTLKQSNPKIYDLLMQERQLQSDSIRLIPSENYASRAVMEATGSWMTNKYSEGYPGKRYYEGQQITDQIETLAIETAKKLFGADHANVQPYSGSVANLAAYTAFAEPGDTIMGLALPYGGHLTHGWKVSVTGRFFRSVQYELDPATGRLDYNRIEDLAKQNKRLQGLRRYCPTGWSDSHVRYGSHCRPDRRRRSPQPRPPCRCRNHDHSQESSRSPRCYDPVPPATRSRR